MLNNRIAHASVRSFVCVLWVMCAAICWGEGFAGGSGTVSSPWQIKTREQLSSLTNYVGSKGAGKYFCLASDIVFTSDDFAAGGDFYDKGAGWLPIGSRSGKTVEGFAGNFDGRGYAVWNLVIRRSQSEDVGLFGYTAGATISNLRLAGINFLGGTNVAGLTGADVGSTFTNCTVNGQVLGTKCTGGLIGYSEDSQLNGCGTDCLVRSDALSLGFTDINSAGGLVGFALRGEISECYGLGKVTCQTAAYEGRSSGYVYVGGLVGYLQESVMSGCFSRGMVTGSSAAVSVAGDCYSGGLVGYLHVSEVADCYAKGTVSADTTLSEHAVPASGIGKGYAGGLVGFGLSSEVVRCYASGSSLVTSGQMTGYAGGVLGASSFGSIGGAVAVGMAVQVICQGTTPHVGRISSVNSGTFAQNMALSPGLVMTANGSTVVAVDDPGYKDGGSATSDQLQNSILYREQLGWNFDTIWKMGDSGYPALIWESRIVTESAPVIMQSPLGATVQLGGELTLSVTATGGNLGYIWFHNGAVVSDQTERTFLLSNIQSADAGIYSVYVFNTKGGATSAEAVVRISSDPPVEVEVTLKNPRYSNEGYLIFDIEVTEGVSVEDIRIWKSPDAATWTEVLNAIITDKQVAVPVDPAEIGEITFYRASVVPDVPVPPVPPVGVEVTLKNPRYSDGGYLIFDIEVTEGVSVEDIRIWKSPDAATWTEVLNAIITDRQVAIPVETAGELVFYRASVVANGGGVEPEDPTGEVKVVLVNPLLQDDGNFAFDLEITGKVSMEAVQIWSSTDAINWTQVLGAKITDQKVIIPVETTATRTFYRAAIVQ